MKEEAHLFFDKIDAIRESKAKTEALISSIEDNRRDLTRCLKNYVKDYLCEEAYVEVSSSGNPDIELFIKFFDNKERDKFLKNHPELENHYLEGFEKGKIKITIREYNIEEI